MDTAPLVGEPSQGMMQQRWMGRTNRMNTVICFAAFVTMAPAACSDRHANRVNMAPDHEKTKSKEGTSARLGPTRLQHFEGEKSQIPYTEPAEDKNGYYYIVYLPGPERWSRTMPEWASLAGRIS